MEAADQHDRGGNNDDDDEMINNTMLRVREARFGTLALWLERSRHKEARRG